MPGMITCEDDPIILIRWWRWSGMMPGMITWSWFHEFDQIRNIVTDVTGLEYRLIDVLVRYHMMQKMSYLRRPMKPTQSPALVAEHWRSPFPEEVLRAVACKCGVKKMVARLTIVKKKRGGDGLESILNDGHLIRPAEGRSCPTDLAISVLSADTNAGHHFH